LTQPVLSPCHRRAIVRTKLINHRRAARRGWMFTIWTVAKPDHPHPY
jgi:hypothetical protein